MKTVFLLAGHHQGDPGACANGLTERDLAKDLRSLVARAFAALPGAQRFRLLQDNDQATLKEVIAWVKANHKPGDILVDIHFNAAAPSAQGAEVLVKSEPSVEEQVLAASLLQACTMAGLKSRGVKTEQDSARGRLGVLHAGPRAALVEVCFITSAKDLEIYGRAKDRIALEMAEALLGAMV